MAVQPRVEQDQLQEPEQVELVLEVEEEEESDEEEKQELDEVKQSIEKSKKTLDQYTRSDDLTDSDLLAEATATILETLCFLSEVDCLNKFLKDTRYDIFSWAVRNHNLSVLDYLLEPSRLSWQDRHSMICDGGYAALRVFVKNSLLMSYHEYQKLDALKEQILSKIISASPDDTVMFVKDELHYRINKENCTIEPEVYAAFKKTFKIARDGKREITQYDIEKEIQFLEKVKRNITNAIDASMQALVEKLNNQNDSSHSENNAPSPR